MTKRKEIQRWREFVAGLPAGYLRDTFEGSENAVEGAILNDVCLPSLEALRRDREEMAQEVKNLAQRRDFLKQEVQRLEGQAARICEGIKSLRLDAEKIACSACSYASYANDLLKSNPNLSPTKGACS